ncbi:MAG TPA: hypothetical protein VMU40_18675 [Steroidobacteraceae bacterium]|nr:hypothetical protein [Steroidobacteraceae bacterium]
MLRLVSLTIALVLLSMTLSHGSTLVRGENRTCHDFADLDYALDHPSSDYFRGWTSSDFDAAQSWVSSCAAAPPSVADAERLRLLNERRRSLEASGILSANDRAIQAMLETQQREQQEEAATQAKQAQAQAAAQAEGERKQRALEAEREAKQATYQNCIHSAPYQRYLAANYVFEALQRQSRAQAILDHEKRVEDISGTVDLSAKHDAAESLVSAQEEVGRWWAVYRQYGGEASAPRSLPPLVDPCSN